MSEARKTVLDNRYDVVRPLGSGGMGEVYLARDRVLGRDVALKVLRKQYAGDDEFAERFKREAMSAASLSHPNIVQVYDRGKTEEGASYIAMEYVPGGTLKERICREGPLEAADAAGLGAQVAEALGAAHDRGMVHRDIKPQNVLLAARGGAKVADFGIARAGSSATISRTGSVMGTAGYMSPEQALGKPATPKSDLYSLGVVLYEALTGVLPYTADNPIAVSMKHVNEPLRPPVQLNPRIPKGMNALVTKLLEKDPEDRYADADELADDLWRVKRGLEPVASGVGRKQGPSTQGDAIASPNVTSKMQKPRPGQVVSYRRRRRLPWLLIALAAILFSLGVLGSVQAVLGPEAMKGWFDVFQGDKRSPGQPAGPKNVKVPEVDGLTRSAAEKRLTDAGLEVGKVTSFPSDSVAAGRVIEPGIVAGTPVKPGTDVNLTISSGPQPSSSASSSASAQSSPESGGDASASSSASAQPAPREDRQATGANGPRANVQRPKVQKNSPAQKQNLAAPAKEPVDDSGGQGRGRGRGRGGGPGED